jgi:lysozyme
MTNVIGPDVSFYQDDPVTPAGIHFEKMRTAAEFVIIRAGQNVWPDPDFKLNWKESKMRVKTGCYWFYDSRLTETPGRIWYSLSKDMGNYHNTDFEEKFGGVRRLGKWTIFLEESQLTGGREIGIYTGYYYWRDHAPNPMTQVKNLEYFHQFPLWIAHYQAPKPKVPKPWFADEWTFWQFTETGSGVQYGVESNAITLIFNGNQEVFRGLIPQSQQIFPIPYRKLERERPTGHPPSCACVRPQYFL